MLRIFGNTAGFDRVDSISFICTTVKLSNMTCRYNPKIDIFAPCSKDVALVARVVWLKISCSWDPGFDSHGMLAV